MGLAGLSALLPFSAGAQALIDETQLVALPAVVPPQEYRFAVPSAQALNLTLTDLQTPKKFTSLQVVVTLNDGLVGQASVPAGAPSVTLPIPAIVSPAAGSEYVVRVVGTPDATQNVGAFGVCVSSATDPTNACIAADSISGTLVTPQPASTSGAAALQTSFTTSAAAGPYVVTLTDDRFPAPLQQLAAGVALNSTPINSSPILAGTPTTLTLAANTTYQLDVAALADAATTAGLYGVHIVDPNGTTVFDRIIPVGELAPPAPVTVTSAQSVALTLTDEAYPAPLVKAMAAVTSGSAALAVLTTPGTQTGIAVPAGTVDV
ncbi:MAG: hypothetical protein KGL34_10880, partial [Gammaproteobacteria bacterium]|nr:hypothetical protein [Gammaproteobacteria bacterium]